jgi:hypothetical protein
MLGNTEIDWRIDKMNQLKETQGHKLPWQIEEKAAIRMSIKRFSADQDPWPGYA